MCLVGQTSGPPIVMKAVWGGRPRLRRVFRPALPPLGGALYSCLMRYLPRKRRIAISLLLALPVVFAQEPAPKKSPEAERAEYFRANYTKYEYLIPMRDGVRLFTSIYAPKTLRRNTQFC